MSELFEKFELCKIDYAQPNSDVDMGELYYFACGFAEYAKSLKEALGIAIGELEEVRQANYDKQPRMDINESIRIAIKKINEKEPSHD